MVEGEYAGVEVKRGMAWIYFDSSITMCVGVSESKSLLRGIQHEHLGMG